MSIETIRDLIMRLKMIEARHGDIPVFTVDQEGELGMGLVLSYICQDNEYALCLNALMWAQAPFKVNTIKHRDVE